MRPKTNRAAGGATQTAAERIAAGRRKVEVWIAEHLHDKLLAMAKGRTKKDVIEELLERAPIKERK